MHRTTIVIAIVLTAGVAHGQDAILVPASGGLGAELPDITARVTTSIENVARQNGLVIKLADASRDDVFAVAGCTADDDPCHQAVLRTLRAEKLILVHVSPGTGAATAEVEIVVASRGAAPVQLRVDLYGATADQLALDLEAKSPPAFGGQARATPPPPDVPVENTTSSGGLNTGEGNPFGQPDTSGERPISPFDTPPPTGEPAPDLTAQGPADAPRGGYDFSRVSNLSWAVGGAGAGLVLTSFVFYGVAGSKQDQVNSARANTPGDIEHLRDLESSGKRWNNIGNTAFLLGLAGLGVGGYMIYRDAKIRPGEETTVSLTPAAIGDGFGLGVVVRR